MSRPPSYRNAARQHGLTLIELLVAMVVSLLVVLAAASALLISRTGFTAVDATAQLRDNARFASDVIQRLAVQAGFQDVAFAATQRKNEVGVALAPPPPVTGFNNATLDSTDPFNTLVPRNTGTVGYGSDVLILRYQASETFPGSNVSDLSMIDCLGNSIPVSSGRAREDRSVSVLHVGMSGNNEPALMCSSSPQGTVPLSTQPLVTGVEMFQVLYGVDGVTPNTALPTNAAAAAALADSIPDRYLRADEMTVAGNANATRANWLRVRSIRIGLVLRGDANSAPTAVAQTLYPFGLAASAANGAPGSAFATANDPGTAFSAPADGRLRQTVTFTVHLRNDAGS